MARLVACLVAHLVARLVAHTASTLGLAGLDLPPGVIPPPPGIPVVSGRLIATPSGDDGDRSGHAQRFAYIMPPWALGDGQAHDAFGSRVVVLGSTAAAAVAVAHSSGDEGGPLLSIELGAPPRAPASSRDAVGGNASSA